MAETDLFLKGQLEMSELPLQDLVTVQLWSDCIVNRIAVVAAIAVMLLALGELFRLTPVILDCLTRYRAQFGLEHSFSEARSRNLCFSVMVFPFCLMASRFGMYEIPPISGLQPEFSLAAYFVVFLAYMLLRSVAFNLVKPKSANAESKAAIHKVFNTVFIPMVAAMLATTGILVCFGAGDRAVRMTLFVEMAVFYLISLTHTAQIIHTRCNGFSTFLYLCALEVLPTGVLIALPVMY